MWKRAYSAAQTLNGQLTRRHLSAATNSSSTAVDVLLLRSLKEHYLEVSKMTPPPKVNPPSGFSIVKGAIDRDGPVLRKDHKDGQEEITIAVMRLTNIIPGGADDDQDDNDSINQLFLHVDISKPGREKSLNFLCGLYPDAMGIHSVCLRPKLESSTSSISKYYQGRVFQELDQKLRDAFHMYMEARGIDERLFRFLQAWLYVKDHRNLMRWFKSLGTFIIQQANT